MNDDSIRFIEALTNGDKALMQTVPRADVHNHAGLGGDFKSWISKEKLELEDNNHYFADFTDFQEFVDKIYNYPFNPPSHQQSIERSLSLYQATYELAISDGITYLEPGIDAVLLDHFENDIEKMISALNVNTGIKLQVFTGVKLQISGKNFLEVNDSYFHPVLHAV